MFTTLKKLSKAFNPVPVEELSKMCLDVCGESQELTHHFIGSLSDKRPLAALVDFYRIQRHAMSHGFSTKQLIVSTRWYFGTMDEKRTLLETTVSNAKRISEEGVPRGLSKIEEMVREFQEEGISIFKASYPYQRQKALKEALYGVIRTQAASKYYEKRGNQEKALHYKQQADALHLQPKAARVMLWLGFRGIVGGRSERSNIHVDIYSVMDFAGQAVDKAFAYYTKPELDDVMKELEKLFNPAPHVYTDYSTP